MPAFWTNIGTKVITSRPWKLAGHVSLLHWLWGLAGGSVSAVVAWILGQGGPGIVLYAVLAFGASMLVYDVWYERFPRFRGTIVNRGHLDPPSRAGMVVVLELTNNGRPTPLRDWKIVVEYDGHDYVLHVSRRPANTIVNPRTGTGVATTDGSWLVERCMKPITNEIVRGYLVGVTNELSHARTRLTTNLRAIATDYRGRKWTFRLGHYRDEGDIPFVFGVIERTIDASGILRKLRPSKSDTEAPPSPEAASEDPGT